MTPQRSLYLSALTFLRGVFAQGEIPLRPKTSIVASVGFGGLFSLRDTVFADRTAVLNRFGPQRNVCVRGDQPVFR